MCAIEDAGWEIRDCLMWLYGSGFPKSMDISKAIDKAAGAEREVIGQTQSIQFREQGRDVGYTVHSANSGYGTSSQFGHGATITAPATEAAKAWQGWGTALKPAWEPVIMAMKPLDGTFAQNALKHGVAGLNVDGARINGKPPSVPQPIFNSPTGQSYGFKTGKGRNGEMSVAQGRWPANLLLDEESARLLDEASGERPSRPAKAAYPVKVAEMGIPAKTVGA